MDPAAPLHSIRVANPGDASEIARLLTLLGHPTEEVDVAARWTEWAAAGNLALVADADGGGLSGVSTLHRTTVLHRPKPVGRITALVVDEPWRGRGLGRVLVAAAEETLTRAGCGLLEITSHVRLVDAHAFYRRIGYEQAGFRFVKNLASGNSSQG